MMFTSDHAQLIGTVKKYSRQPAARFVPSATFQPWYSGFATAVSISEQNSGSRGPPPHRPPGAEEVDVLRGAVVDRDGKVLENQVLVLPIADEGDAVGVRQVEALVDHLLGQKWQHAVPDHGLALIGHGLAQRPILEGGDALRPYFGVFGADPTPALAPGRLARSDGSRGEAEAQDEEKEREWGSRRLDRARDHNRRRAGLPARQRGKLLRTWSATRIASAGYST
jgi:hypothetical protein